jgi:lipoate-protein ligase A
MMKMKKDQWRLIHSPPASGSWNMAVDEALLESVQSGNAPPTLRLYDWQPATLTLGYAQPIRNVDFAGLEKHGWGLVRRPTGGRAILHADEITYSVVASTSEERVAGGVLESYKRLAQALLRSVEHLEVPAIGKEKSKKVNRSKDPNPICFESPSDYEITVDGKKLLGSAQARRKEGMLQHGSLPLFGDIGRIAYALSFSDEDKRERAAERVRESASNVESAIGRRISWESAADAFAHGFSEALNLELVKVEMTNKEIASAKKWEKTKYANKEWTERV